MDRVQSVKHNEQSTKCKAKWTEYKVSAPPAATAAAAGAAAAAAAAAAPASAPASSIRSNDSSTWTSSSSPRMSSAPIYFVLCTYISYFIFELLGPRHGY